MAASRAKRHGSNTSNSGSGLGLQADDDDGAPAIFFERRRKNGHGNGEGVTPGQSGKPGVVRGGGAMAASSRGAPQWRVGRIDVGKIWRSTRTNGDVQGIARGPPEREIKRGSAVTA